MTESERETRIHRIDHALRLAGWDVNDPKQVVQEMEIQVGLPDGVAAPQTSYQGKQFSDYVLLGRNGKPLAVVEAKKASVDAKKGEEQARQYCYNIQKERGGPLPFCFYTNGLDMWFWNLEHDIPRKVMGFPTRDDLQRWQYIRRNTQPLDKVALNTAIAGRPYQLQAIRAVLENLQRNRNRSLLVMATGTGKTRTCIALVEALLHAGRATRFLFLVDRIALRNQALDAFKEHLPDEPRWPQVGEKALATDRRIYVSTYPSMLNILRDEDTHLSPHFFDYIVIDESHRSIYNTYQEILKYFHAPILGLTATPTDVIDHNTFELFQCEAGLPTFAFSYEEAVSHAPPYLCDYEVLKVQTKFQLDGINKRTITLEDQKKLIAEGQSVEEIDFEGSQLERQVTNRDTNLQIVKEFMAQAIKDEAGVLPGKTIFFCVSKRHARQIEDIFNELYPEYHGELAKVLVSDDPRVYGKGGLLDQFTRQDYPRVAISVDMLDTGIDVREIVNMVFAKPVYSFTKFWQMIGRGTRLLEANKLKPWCTEKTKFLIIDCWDNFDYFKLNPKGKENSVSLPLPLQLFALRLDKLKLALSLNRQDIVQAELVKVRQQIAALPQNSVTIKEAASQLHPLADDSFWTAFGPQHWQYLRFNIQRLFAAQPPIDAPAMRFERDILEYSLRLFQGRTADAQALGLSLAQQLASLPRTIRFVEAQAPLLNRAQVPAFWNSASEADLNEVNIKLGPLMRFVPAGGPSLGPTELNFKDEIQMVERVSFDAGQASATFDQYRQQVEAAVVALTRQNPLLQRLRDGYTLTPNEIASLASFLDTTQPRITEDHLRRAYQNHRASLVQFIRHILGLEAIERYPETVSAAFTQFTGHHTTLTSQQLEFLKLLQQFVTERHEVQRKDLISAPFTVLHKDGIRGLFNPEQIADILELTQTLTA